MERADLEQWRAKEVARLLSLVETQRRYYQDIVASIPVGLLVLSSDLAVLLANGAARRIFGLRGGDSPHRRLDTILPAWVLDRVEEVLRTGIAQTGLVVEDEREPQRKLRIGILSMRNWDDEGAKEALLSVEDLSSVELAIVPDEEGAPETEAALPAIPAFPANELIDHLDAVTWAVELPGMNFVVVSPQLERLLGFPPAYWTANETSWLDRVQESDRDWVASSYQRAIERDAGHSCEFRMVAADGRVLWVRESARVLARGEGEPSYLVGLTVDATERRMLEDQLVQSERVEAVSRLASRMAHDLNNVLMILTGYGEELLNGLPQGSALRSDVQEILAATERMSGLTGQLLSFARRQGAAASYFGTRAGLERDEATLERAAGDRIRPGPRTRIGSERCSRRCRAAGAADQCDPDAGAAGHAVGRADHDRDVAHAHRRGPTTRECPASAGQLRGDFDRHAACAH